MKTFPIKVGKGRSPVVLDAAHLVDGCAIIQGTRGSGKSYGARIIAEQTIPKGLQTIILDPEGEFSTLREHCNLLIAGRDGDVPCEPRSAKLLARRIAETRVSAVVDLSDLKLDQRREMVRVFLDTLCNLPRKLEAPRLVILDEAHVYCPESGKGKATSTEAVTTLMSQGRKRGLGAVLLTQRLSKLKKDAAAEAAHRLIGKTSPIDLKTARDLLGVTQAEGEKLRTLKPGTFYVEGPGFSTDEPTVLTIPRSKTTHPKAGSRYKTTTPPPKQAISRILKEFKELPPSKEDEKAQNVADLKKRVRELERELSKKQREVPAVDSKQLQQLKAELDTERRHGKANMAWYQNSLAKYEKVLSSTQRQLKKTISFLTKGKPETVQPEKPAVAQQPRPAPPPKAAPRTVTPSTSNDLSFGWKSAPGKLLTILVQYHPEYLPAGRLASLAGVNHKSSTFRNALTKLRNEGVVHQEGNTFAAPEETAELFRDQLPELPSGDELISGWKTRLGNGVPRRIFDALVDEGGTCHRDDLGQIARVDITTSTYRNALTKLRNHGLLEKTRGEALHLAPHVVQAL